MKITYTIKDESNGTYYTGDNLQYEPIKVEEHFGELSTAMLFDSETEVFEYLNKIEDLCNITIVKLYSEDNYG